MARDKAPQAKEPGAVGKFRSAYTVTKQHDPKVGLICAGWFLTVAVVVGVVAWLVLPGVGGPIAGAVLGVLAGILAALVVFSRRAEKAAYAQVEGKPGAAGAALGVLRRGWQVQHAVAVTRNQDLVHRVVGRPGVVLVGEGNPSRTRNLLAVEKKRHARVVGEAPIYDVLVGDGDDAVPVRKLAKHIMKLPRNITPADVTDLLQRLKALDATRPQAPVPKGPMPTSMRQARQGLRQSMRGR